MPRKKKLRVLIVEDREEDALLLLRELRRAYEPEFRRVATEEEMTAALEEPWDIVISDYSMPTFDGLRAIKVLQSCRPEIPLIIVSGAIGEEIAVMAMKSGANDYVMKDNVARLLPAIERELREAEGRRERARGEAAIAHLAAIVESSSDAIIGMNLDGTVTSWNSGAENTYGYTADEAIGRHISIVAPPVSAGEIPHIFQKIRQGERVERYQTVRVKKDGTPIDVSLMVSPIYSATGEVVGVSSIERDITSEKRAEAERKRLIDELSEALKRVRTLSGLLPICASCKKIRDDKGEWEPVENYIKAHSEANFSHGMCPDCMEKWYPNYTSRVKNPH
jgi:PAS domain S-box-containing protein